MIEETFTSETALRERYGLTAKSLQKIRGTLAESDWKKEGREICYTESGVKKIKAALQLDSAPDPEPVEAVKVPVMVLRATKNKRIVLGRLVLLPPGPALEEDLARVLGLEKKFAAAWRFQRLRVGEDYEQAGGVVTYTQKGAWALQDAMQPVVRIRVKDSKFFRSGMLLECETTETPGLFRFSGKAPKMRRNS